jgi:hypothetical protein
LYRFREGGLGLDRTIIDLRASSQALEEPVDGWWGRFRVEWSDLELAYAVALINGGPLPDSTDLVLNKASQNMLEIIRERLAEASPSERRN